MCVIILYTFGLTCNWSDAECRTRSWASRYLTFGVVTMPLITSRAYPLALSLTEPEGFWVAAGRGVHCQDLAKRIPAYRAAAVCPPPVVNDVASVVTTPAMSGQGVGSLVQRSARISGSGIGLVAASRAAVVAQVATSPDSLMPSRMAALSTMYASQHVISSDITPIAAENKNARPTASLNAAFMASPVVSGIIKFPECRTCSACGGEYWVHFGLVSGKGWFMPHACVGGVIVGIPKARRSNLDLNGRLVKKGALVSWHGYRFHVSKVRMGTCYPVFSPVDDRRFFDCESVQVIG